HRAPGSRPGPSRARAPGSVPRFVHAEGAEPAHAADSKSVVPKGRVGSPPTFGTNGAPSERVHAWHPSTAPESGGARQPTDVVQGGNAPASRSEEGPPRAYRARRGARRNP